MRDIKFRGKRNDGKWVYGHFYHDQVFKRGVSCVDVYIIRDDLDQDHEVKEKTVGQYTGLEDKNRKEIYSGDLFNCIYDFDGCNNHKMEVYWNEYECGFRLRILGDNCQQSRVIQTMNDMTRKEIIGNIYENPELLKKT